jgi:hypothetical protein
VNKNGSVKSQVSGSVTHDCLSRDGAGVPHFARQQIKSLDAVEDHPRPSGR